MSALEREENRLYEAFKAARQAQGLTWPEPETSRLYTIIHKATAKILATRNSALLYNYGKYEASSRVAEEVLLNIGAFDGRSRFSTWLYRMARNELYDIVREIKGLDEVALSDSPEPEAKSAETLQLPLGLLEPDEERLVRLRIEEGLNFRELAKIFEISLGGVHNLWREALEKLKSRLTN